MVVEQREFSSPPPLRSLAGGLSQEGRPSEASVSQQEISSFHLKQTLMQEGLLFQQRQSLEPTPHLDREQTSSILGLSPDLKIRAFDYHYPLPPEENPVVRSADIFYRGMRDLADSEKRQGAMVALQGAPVEDLGVCPVVDITHHVVQEMVSSQAVKKEQSVDAQTILAVGESLSMVASKVTAPGGYLETSFTREIDRLKKYASHAIVLKTLSHMQESIQERLPLHLRKTIRGVPKSEAGNNALVAD